MGLLVKGSLLGPDCRPVPLGEMVTLGGVDQHTLPQRFAPLHKTNLFVAGHHGRRKFPHHTLDACVDWKRNRVANKEVNRSFAHTKRIARGWLTFFDSN